jgi:hypothetical protein
VDGGNAILTGSKKFIQSACLMDEVCAGVWISFFFLLLKSHSGHALATP